MARYFEPLIMAAIGTASKIVSSQQQMAVLDQTKTLAESALQMLYTAKEAGGNPKVTPPSTQHPAPSTQHPAPSPLLGALGSEDIDPLSTKLKHHNTNTNNEQKMFPEKYILIIDEW